MSEPSPRFEFYALSFRLRANEPFTFPALLTGNVFRGALGSFLKSANSAAYRILFGPGVSVNRVRETPPRPFVLRCRNLDGHSFSPGEIFSLNLNLFLPDLELLDALTAAVTAMGEKGFGPSRARATLLFPAECTRHSFAMDGPRESTRAVRIHFHTPTELKVDGKTTQPIQFPTLVAQICRRLNCLSTTYGSGRLTLDERALQKQAKSVALASSDLSLIDVSRRTSRSGQVHPIGGYVGSVNYSGNLDSFIPILETASFTGVGRHTVWGNGEISTERLE